MERSFFNISTHLCQEEQGEAHGLEFKGIRLSLFSFFMSASDCKPLGNKDLSMLCCTMLHAHWKCFMQVCVCHNVNILINEQPAYIRAQSHIPMLLPETCTASDNEPKVAAGKTEKLILYVKILLIPLFILIVLSMTKSNTGTLCYITLY